MTPNRTLWFDDETIAKAREEIEIQESMDRMREILPYLRANPRYSSEMIREGM